MIRERLLKLLKEKAFERKAVTLASGKPSDFYIDVKRASLTAEGAYLLGEMFWEALMIHFPQAKGVGGLTLGADPLATATAYTSFLKNRPLDAFIVRKETKAHGLKRFIEGGVALQKGDPVVILEDVVTSGKSSIEACRRVRDHGWKVLGVLAVVDRLDGGAENIAEELKQEGSKLVSLFSKSDFI